MGHTQTRISPRREAARLLGSYADSQFGRSGSGGDTLPCVSDSSPLVVRVLPDIRAIDKTFDYVLPDSWHVDGKADRIDIGSMVRVDLHGRRVAGWIVEIGSSPPENVDLAPLRKLSGIGPSADIIDLAEWASWRWAGRRVSFLRAASPRRMIAGVSRPARTEPVPSGPVDGFDEAFDLDVGVVRLPPRADLMPLAMAAVRRGPSLILTPELSTARRLANQLRRAGVRVALGPDDWALAAGGSTVVGTRSAAWMPMPSMAAALVFDEHDESLQEERSPTWHARDVVVERARRTGVPVVLVSPVPSLESLRAGRLLKPGRSEERAGWPRVDVLDRRSDDPTKAGPFAELLLRRLPDAGRVVFVLNRKGRARLLACSACGELARTSDGQSPMVIDDVELVSADRSERRPIVCSECGSTVLRNLRMGVTRAREELSALLGEPVGEVTADSDQLPDERAVIGTEAVLRRLDTARAVTFLDFDQELLATRQRADEQAMALLARAARMIDQHEEGRIIVQTRQPDHVVIQAALKADPSLVAVSERDRRQEAQIPPYGAQVLLAGAGAAELATAAGAQLGIDVRGPIGDQYVLRAVEHKPLLDALATAPRPSERVRIEVDPLRI